jgi:membrane protease subunit (stomatin/prohibitin family)
MFMRRRPLVRAAVLGGGAYVAGKKAAQGSAERAQQEQQSASPQPPAAAAEPSMADQLGRLGTLHQQGTLTDSEFATAKAKLLGS